MSEIKNSRPQNNPLMVAVSPHAHSKTAISTVMRDVILALLPAAGAALYYFGWVSVRVIAVSVSSAVIAEYLWFRFLKQKPPIKDLSAVLTGLLLALTLPPGVPLWMAAAGAVFAVIIGKQVFGGLGYNPFNPALAGRAFLQISWPVEMNTWLRPFDAVTTATPLAIKKFALVEKLPSYIDLFLGNRAGSIGETSAAVLILGGIFVLLRGHITPVIPVTFILTVAAGAYAFGQDALFHVLNGGLVFGAIFMATDPVTSPVSGKGKFIFAAGCGIMTVLIRTNGSFPDGVCFSILLMNMLVPLIDKFTIPNRFGAKQ